jgi:hypothetical protein
MRCQQVQEVQAFLGVVRTYTQVVMDPGCKVRHASCKAVHGRNSTLLGVNFLIEACDGSVQLITQSYEAFLCLLQLFGSPKPAFCL